MSDIKKKLMEEIDRKVARKKEMAARVAARLNEKDPEREALEAE